VKFRCERDVLASALATAGRAVSSRNSQLPVLAGLRLELSGEQLTISGSDLDLTIACSVTVSAEADGIIVIPAKLLADVVRSLEPGAVTLEVVEGDALVTGGRSQFSIRTIAAEEFPQLPEAEGDTVTLDAPALAAALRQVVPAASSNDSRPVLTGVLLAAAGGDDDDAGTGLRLVATDSYRLSVRGLPEAQVLGAGQKVLVPSRALGELARLLGEESTVALRLGERDASFEVGGVHLTTRLIEGDFPRYQGLIPSDRPNRLTVDRQALLEAIRRVRLMAVETTPIRLAMSQDGLELIVISQDVGQAHETLDATYEGEDLTVAFNADYLLDGVEVADGDEVTLETVDALKPAVLETTESPGFLYLLMPVRVS
jgi:DNA polymerase-3 subunit beta